MSAKRRLKLEDYCAIRQVSHPQISPDGKKVVFNLTNAQYIENKYVTQVHLTDLDRNQRQLTWEGSNNWNPTWSPSGDEIAFLSNLDERPGLWKTTLEGGIPERIGGVGENIIQPEWSPDSRKILFLSRVPQGQPHDSDVLVIRRLPYKFDGLGFLSDKWRHLFALDARGGESKQLTEGEYDVSVAAWSSDSSRIAYLANKSEEASFTDRNDVWVTDLDGDEHVKITDGSKVFKHLSYSPDGRWLALIGNTDRYGLATKNDIFALNLASGEELNLTAIFDLKVGDQVNGGTGTGMDPSPVWSSDSKAIHFLTARGGNGNLYKVSLDSEVELVSDATRTIQAYCFSRDQRVMASLTTDMASPSEIWVSERGRTRKLTGFNDKFVESVSLSRGENFTFKASDGVPVDGWLYMPIGSTGERSPMVMILKGGPHGSCWGNAFSFQAQVLAANGYSVLYTNERGSGGYGEEFAKTARARFYGERDFRDLMEAVDHVIAKYSIDEERLGITGYSRGGFLTNWTITHSDRFKAAVSAGGFSDVYSFFGTGDNIYIWCEKNYEGTPWDDEELYMSKSPLKFVKNIKTPTMIIHAQQDFRAPVSQAEQLYVSLKRLGKETELVIFPGESHGLPRGSTPRHMIEYNHHILRWFNRFLQ
jgi:dipeptidyl aminopeptidase/acylaminoacyl peptidase